jgi:hypothetical protein
MGALPQALQIIFEVQSSKRSNEKIAIRKINFSTYKTHFKKKTIPLFGPLLFSKLINLFFLFI